MDVVAPDPDELYEVDSDAHDGAVLLYHLDGFVDAGSAGSAAVDHLRDELDATVVARFDLDRLLDYRSRRPPMTYAGDHWRDITMPELAVRVLHDRAGTPFLLLSGPEPDREWELFTAAVRNLIERWQVRLAVNFHGIPMGVPHSRPLGLTAHATRKELISEHRARFGELRIPGSAAALLELRLGEAGHDAVGFAIHVPHYLAQATYHAAAVAALEAVMGVTGLDLPLDTLRDAAARTDEEVDRQVNDSEEVSEVVRGLEDQYDAFNAASGDDNLLADDVPMPTGDELASQFERFLADRQRGDEDQ